MQTFILFFYSYSDIRKTILNMEVETMSKSKDVKKDAKKKPAKSAKEKKEAKKLKKGTKE